MNDDEIWYEITKNVKKLKIKERHVNYEKPDLKNIISKLNKDLPIKLSDEIRSIKKNNYDNLNDLTIKKFKKFEEDYSILDLHGKNIERSIKLFEEFIRRNFLLNKRYLLIITGKGNLIDQSYNGKIKNEIINWFNFPSINQLILTYSDAPKTLGGEGALIILLRKNL